MENIRVSLKGAIHNFSLVVIQSGLGDTKLFREHGICNPKYQSSNKWEWSFSEQTAMLFAPSSILKRQQMFAFQR